MSAAGQQRTITNAGLRYRSSAMTAAKSIVRSTVSTAGSLIAPFLFTASTAVFCVASADSWLAHSVVMMIALVAAVLLRGMLAPGRFRRGVCVVEGGFDVWRPLCRPILIRYDEVISVTAISLGDGDTNDDLLFQNLHAASDRLVADADLFGTSVFDGLQLIAGFSMASDAAARSHRATSLQALFGQRFALLDRRYHCRNVRFWAPDQAVRCPPCIVSVTIGQAAQSREPVDPR